ncbi:Predicted arabinose efflux permease, MFS family [Amycolatopsis xylanica]|uniref:Predicted arabinose efflux permease, MFS family n=1 Tax=Amycolatopsis xylanica TaxID=589385 RepID=A0A1H2YMV7_9PSEU|nr:MFS transporter [Amycolatopsis xylanica]SDX06516.1 Predicted arabinose efflux permease, MFS family [Amycolatopsis xylanica]
MRDFRLLWAGETISLLGSNVAAVALPLVAVVTLHADTFTVGLLSAVAWLPWFLIGLPAGALVDRSRKRPIMLACNVISMVLFVSIPVAAWFGVLTVAQLLVVALLGGVTKVFFTTAYRAYVPLIVHDGQLLGANARLQGSESAVQVAGPGLGGALAQAFGAAAGLLADAVSFGVSALLLRFVKTEEDRPKRSERRLRAEIADGVRFLARDPYLRRLAVFAAISNVALEGYQAIQIVFLSRDLGLSPGLVGLALAVSALGGVAGAGIAGRISARIGTARAFLLAEAVAALLLLIGPFGLVTFVIAGIAINMGLLVSNILTVTFRQRYCPPELFGRITTSIATLSYGGIALGALLGGVLGEWLGVRPTMWIMAPLQFVAVLVVSPLWKERDFPNKSAGHPPHHLQPQP